MGRGGVLGLHDARQVAGHIFQVLRRPVLGGLGRFGGGIAAQGSGDDFESAFAGVGHGVGHRLVRLGVALGGDEDIEGQHLGAVGGEELGQLSVPGAAVGPRNQALLGVVIEQDHPQPGIRRRLEGHPVAGAPVEGLPLELPDGVGAVQGRRQAEAQQGRPPDLAEGLAGVAEHGGASWPPPRA
jgi:hypothetical protein